VRIKFIFGGDLLQESSRSKTRFVLRRCGENGRTDLRWTTISCRARFASTTRKASLKRLLTLSDLSTSSVLPTCSEICSVFHSLETARASDMTWKVNCCLILKPVLRPTESQVGLRSCWGFGLYLVFFQVLTLILTDWCYFLSVAFNDEILSLFLKDEFCPRSWLWKWYLVLILCISSFLKGALLCCSSSLKDEILSLIVTFLETARASDMTWDVNCWHVTKPVLRPTESQVGLRNCWGLGLDLGFTSFNPNLNLLKLDHVVVLDG